MKSEVTNTKNRHSERSEESSSFHQTTRFFAQDKALDSEWRI